MTYRYWTITAFLLCSCRTDLLFDRRGGTQNRAMQKLNALTGLRFFAALGIAILHARGAMGVPPEVPEVVFHTLFQGVSFFFVLSGFILTYNYPQLESVAARRRFLWSRFARLWPAHMFAFLLVLVLGVPYWGGAWAAILNVLMLHAWIPVKEIFFSYNSVSWSISTEFGFYFLFPLLILNFQRNWACKFLISILLCLFLLLICWVFQLPQFPDYGVGSRGFYYTSPLGRLFEFVAGMAGALLWRRQGHRFRFGMAASTGIELAVVLLLLSFGLYYVTVAPALGISVEGMVSPVWFATLWYTPIVSALVIWIFACGKGGLSYLLSTRPIIFLGEISYSIYLVHLPLRTFFAMHEASLAPIFGRGILIVYAVTVLAVASVSWWLIEKRLRKFLLALLPYITRSENASPRERLAS